jgi:hypothetical protein
MLANGWTQTARRDLVRSQTYEIIFAGQAGAGLRAEFDDCEVTVGADTTTLRAELPDQAALVGLVLRITGLGLEVVLMRLVPPDGGPAKEGAETGGSQASA